MTVRTTAVLAAMGLAFGLAACGDDDSEATDTTEADAPAEGDTAAFCDNLLEFNSAVFDIELDEESSEEEIKAAGAEVGPMMQAIVDSAPEDLADDAEELNEPIQLLEEGDAGPFNADETFESYTAFVSGAVPKCDFEEVGVTAVDYAFEDVPATIEAGTVAFALTNVSETEEHEMVVFSRPEGETRSFEELLALPEEEAEQAVVFATAAFAPPGGSGSTLTELEAGDYAMVCFIPVGGAEDGPPHFTQGMLQEFVVE